MATVIEPDPGDYESEWRYLFGAAAPEGPHVVISGSCGTTEIKGTKDDLYELYEVHLIVGPYFGQVISVVPQVTVQAFQNTNADEDDEQGWFLNQLTWDAVSGTGAYISEERIRLTFTAAVKGENSRLERIGYYVFARGRTFGHDGIHAPPPSWPNP